MIFWNVWFCFNTEISSSLIDFCLREHFDNIPAYHYQWCNITGHTFCASCFMYAIQVYLNCDSILSLNNDTRKLNMKLRKNITIKEVIDYGKCFLRVIKASKRDLLLIYDKCIPTLMKVLLRNGDCTTMITNYTGISYCYSIDYAYMYYSYYCFIQIHTAL